MAYDNWGFFHFSRRLYYRTQLYPIIPDCTRIIHEASTAAVHPGLSTVWILIVLFGFSISNLQVQATDSQSFSGLLRRMVRLFGLVSSGFLLQFLYNRFGVVFRKRRLQLAQRYSDNIPMVQFMAKSPVCEIQPDLMQQFRVLGPEPGRMRPKVEVHLFSRFLIQDFKR
jgi:hypothetical protein